MNKILKQFKGLPSIYRYYGIELFVLTILVRFTRLPFCVNIRHRFILKYLEKHYLGNVNISNEPSTTPSKKIAWVMWWQDCIPDVIQMCIGSIKRNLKGYEVIVISEKTFSKYVELPDFIKKKVAEGLISITHLSDIIRFKLLRKYGGVWLDATTIIPHELYFDNLFLHERPYWTTRFKERFSMCISNYRWNGAEMYMNQNYILARFADDFFMEYWKNENSLIDYWLIDYVTDIAFRYIPEYHNDLASVDIYPDDFYHLNMNVAYDEKLLDSLLPMYKIQRRDNFITVHNGKPTIFKKLYDSFV